MESCDSGLIGGIDLEADLVVLGEEELLQKSLIIKVFFESGLAGERWWLDGFDGIHDGRDEHGEVVGGCGRLVCGVCVCHSGQGNLANRCCQQNWMMFG